VPGFSATQSWYWCLLNVVSILPFMKSGRSMLVCLLAVLAAGLTAKAVAPAKDTGGFPYQKIIDRNAFRLNPAPPPQSTEPPKPPPPKVSATGIANMFGRKVALLKILEPAQPPAPAVEQSYILAEDERQGELVVLAINEQAATVKVNNYGTEQLLTLKTNLPVVAPPVAVPGAPPGVNPAAAPAGGGVTMGGAAVQPNTAPKTTIPTRTLRLPTPPGAPPPQTQPQAPVLSAEEQFILLHAAHQNDPSMPPPPPMPGAEEMPGMPGEPMPGVPQMPGMPRMPGPPGMPGMPQ
jgi:hypothetical protein